MLKVRQWGIYFDLKYVYCSLERIVLEESEVVSGYCWHSATQKKEVFDRGNEEQNQTLVTNQFKVFYCTLGCIFFKKYNACLDWMDLVHHCYVVTVYGHINVKCASSKQNVSAR